MVYTLTIGLEVHCKLLTESKVFCRCRNEQDFDSLPANTHICPVCTGQPGALPCVSYECIIKAGALGKLLGCVQQTQSHFDRKSYFYPDLPMGYQITQFSMPLNINGCVSYFDQQYATLSQAHITQAHLECDTAKSSHVGNDILLDYNRANTPLVEIVTAPDFHHADDVVAFLKEIQRTLKFYKISQADMDKGQMRCDVNISISDTAQRGTKVEIKNMNSLGAIKKAIEYEYKRQTELVISGQQVIQETRGWNEQTESTYSMRSKEDALDYRYFPEPDIPTVMYTPEMDAASLSLIGEPIATKIQRYVSEYGLHKEYINGILSDPYVTKLFETLIGDGYEPTLIAKYVVNFILASVSRGTLTLEETGFDPAAFVIFLDAVRGSMINDNIAKSILTEYISHFGGDEGGTTWMKKAIASQATTEKWDLSSIISEVITEHSHVVTEYKNGKQGVLGFLIGQVMKKTQGKGNPQEINELLRNMLA